MEKQNRKYDEDGLVVRVNKEEEKRKRDEIKTFVKELLKIANDKYLNLPFDQVLNNALIEAKRLKGNALKRHLSFIVRLVHEQDFPNIQSVYERLHHPYRNDPGKIREVKYYRDRLIAGDKDVIDEIIDKFANVDIQYIRQLSRNVDKEIKAERQRFIDLAEKIGQPFDADKPTKPTKSSKLLYRYLFKLELL